jgi:1,4-dihydroxy-2-naphthoyl-CoA hydrolase
MTDAEPFLQSRGFDAFYGLELLELGPETARARLTVRDEHKQPFGLVHGGLYASIAEGLASYSTVSVVLPTGHLASGMSNSTSFLRPVTGGTIDAHAVCQHAGRTTWVWEVEMRDDQGRLCAVSRVTIAVRPLPDDGSAERIAAGLAAAAQTPTGAGGAEAA